MRSGDRLWGVIVAIVFLVMIGGLVGNCRGESGAAACNARGYPDARVRWLGYGTIYCVKRVEQTDVVKPLEMLP